LKLIAHAVYHVASAVIVPVIVLHILYVQVGTERDEIIGAVASLVAVSVWVAPLLPTKS
jgi:uncharacterized membrane protein